MITKRAAVAGALASVAGSATAQNRTPSSLTDATGEQERAAKLLAGQWTYRSFVNSPDLVGNDAGKALGLIFGEGVFAFEAMPTGTVRGTLDFGGGVGLDLAVTIRGGVGALFDLALVGTGRPDSPTAGWEYDYRCGPGYSWPDGLGQVLVLLGTVLRAKPHGGAPAGFVASFIAVKQT